MDHLMATYFTSRDKLSRVYGINNNDAMTLEDELTRKFGHSL